jgi:hypothetical protein
VEAAGELTGLAELADLCGFERSDWPSRLHDSTQTSESSNTLLLGGHLQGPSSLSQAQRPAILRSGRTGSADWAPAGFSAF